MSPKWNKHKKFVLFGTNVAGDILFVRDMGDKGYMPVSNKSDATEYAGKLAVSIAQDKVAKYFPSIHIEILEI